MAKHPKIVESPHYHIWTDALHARTLAHQGSNQWDRGTYVRWCTMTAWTALEIACQLATGDKSISYRFRENLDSAIDQLSRPPLNWGSGVWKRVSEIQERRKGYVHRFLTETDLFPEASIADEAIQVIRAGIVEIYKHVGLPWPPWIEDNDDRGWDEGRRHSATLTITHAGVSADQNENIRICFVSYGAERTSEVLPPGADWKPYVEGLLKGAAEPISEVRVYRGNDMLESTPIRMRGT